MFTNPKILKRLMKEAYKANYLIIGRKEDDYYIQGSYWKLLCNKNYIPKTIFAQIIELAGEIPDEGECFCSGKGGNQMQINPMEIVIPENAKKVDITDYILLSKTGVAQSLLQFPEGKIVLINNVFAAATRGKHYEEELGELPAEGPYCSLAHGVFWKNENMKFTVCFREDSEHAGSLEQMECIDLAYTEESKG